MNPSDIGIVYDGGIRDNGTPYYARVALAKVSGKDPEWWSEATPIDDLKGCRFLLHVDDGRDDLPVDGLPHPWGYWIIDSHLGPDIRIEKARRADIVWCAQKPFVERLASEGIPASWLPLACEPLHHPTAEELIPDASTPIRWDLAFVGFMQNPASSSRVSFLHSLFEAFPNSWLAHGYFHADMAHLYHQARIGINHAVRDDLNMRFFELASAGVPQLADRRMVGLKALGFTPSVHFIPYESSAEAIEQVRFWLPREDARFRIAKAAHDVVRSAHTYEHRVRQMLDDIRSGGF